ncbi:RidA family protein [Prauserella flavalba]|uniref:YjgF translation initiation inhibitor n=1 Tax=Prauserella flavalba TaxID=1477506 RepID=A0A318LA63_9PSEU|nr:RidA family protein [Prauserella flavalba]PXY18442.1 YjgF translation initiation inhibitor [Prauserella flavalba]
MTTALERLESLRLELPVLGAPRYAYEASVRWGNLLFVSGQISRTAAGEVLTGRLGDNIDTTAGASAARVSALNLLARLHDAVGLDKIERILKITTWVTSTHDFVDQPTVADGASRLLPDVLGDAGRHARTALPAHVLPAGALVEIEATVAVRD